MSTWEPPTGPIPVHPVQRGGSRIGWVVALIAVAVLLGVLALWAGIEAADRSAEADRLNQTADRVAVEATQLVDSVDAGNDALSDTEQTEQLSTYLTTAVEATFSYNYADLASTENAVDEHLTGKARCMYDAMFSEVKKYAPEQKIVLDTTVRELAIVRIDGDRAEALVYIDQLSTRVDVNKTVAVGGQFAVQAHRDGDHWKITEFDMLGQPLVNGKPAPTC